MSSVEQERGALNLSVGGKRSFLRGHHTQTEKNQKELGKMRQGKGWDKEEKLVKGAASTMALRLREQNGLINKSGPRDIKTRRARDESGEFPGSPVVRTQHSHCQGCRFNPSKELRPRQGQKKKKKLREPGRPSTSQILTELTSFVREFVFYPEDDRESLKSFKHDSFTF